MKKLKAQVIKFAKKLNKQICLALRSGNISVRATERDINGILLLLLE